MLEVEPTPETPAAGDAPSAPRPFIPVHLHAYREVGRMRTPYPLCLYWEDGGLRVTPLGELLDAAADSTDVDGDEAELFQRTLRKVEAWIRRNVPQEAGLAEVWKEAVAAVVDGLREDRREHLSELLTTAGDSLPKPTSLLGLCPAVPTVLMRHAAAEQARRLGVTMGPDLEGLVLRAEQILAYDDAAETGGNRLPGAMAVDGDGGVDADAFAELVGKVSIRTRLPEVRRRRIKGALEIARGLSHVVSGHVPGAGLWSHEPVLSVEVARSRATGRLETLVDFFAAVHTLALEIDNRYREDQHDQYFGAYQLAPFERGLCPPVLLQLDARSMSPADRAELLDLLGTELPVKGLVVVDDVLPSGDPRDSAWQASLATMAMSLHHPHVAQAAVSDPAGLWEAFGQGFDATGPALFSVYSGGDTGEPALPPYLRAAAAVEGRAFPIFTYSPARSREPGERLSLDGSPQPERSWPTEAVKLGSGDSAREEEIPFTFAEFVACDAGMAAYFEPLAEGRQVDAMLPLAEYLDLPSDETRGRVPYILAICEGDEPTRLIVDSVVVEATRRASTAWRALQEAAGIRSVHALQAIEQERARLEQEKQEALDDLRAAHKAALEQSTGEVAEQIVSNLAARLLDLTEAPFEMPAPRTAAPKAPAAAPGPAATPTEAQSSDKRPTPPAAEEEDEPLALDEAYIETPRCTTCNECTNINGQMFAYDGNKQAYIIDVNRGSFREMVLAAEKCPVDIIHPGKPWNPDEPGLDELVKRAEPYL